MNWLIDSLEIIFWKVAKRIILKGYGYCEERDGGVFMKNGRCGACDASDVCDFIDNHISLIEDFKDW